MNHYLRGLRRHRWLLAPALIVLLVAAALALWTYRTTPRYLAEATVAVNLDPWRTRQIGEAPPAAQHAELLGELLQTDTFITAALARAFPTGGGASEADRAAQVRTNWRHRPLGANTLRASYRCARPDGCAETVTAILAAFQDEVTAARQAKRRALIASLQTQAQTLDQNLQALSATDPSRATVRQSLDAIQSRLADAQIEAAAELQGSQSDFKVIAPARASYSTMRAVQAAALPLVGGLVVALLLALTPLAIMLWTDRTLHSPEDVLDRLGARTVAVVPPAAWTSSAPSLGAGQLADESDAPLAAPGWGGARGTVSKLDQRLGAFRPTPQDKDSQ